MTLPPRAFEHPSDRPATIYDVAKLAGVSHQTVSRMLQGYEGIRPQTRAKVQVALDELDYRPNLAARSLATNRSQRIGALVYELLEVGPSKTIQGASDAARHAGYLLDIVTLDPRDDSAVEQALSVLRTQDLAGIVAFAPMDLLSDRIQRADFSVPVLLETDVDQAAAATHTSVSDSGMHQVVDHLVSLGHATISYISGPLEWWASRNRKSAFEAALAEHGLVSAGTIEGSWSAASGYRAGMELPLDRGMTAVVAANDQMALGILRALAERGISVPGDISVTGFDDIPESEYYQSPLTTVRINYEHQGRTLMNRLLTTLGVDQEPKDESADAPVLVPRESTGPARR
ncbi:MAG: LacI family DNA-binding transcriptional regulator, partial [Lacisediminihabitans sp.]